MPHTIVTVATIAVMPTFINFLNEKSSPIANSRKMTPMSAHILILAGSKQSGPEKRKDRHNTGYNVAQYDQFASAT